jgi:hypothetical protein
MRRRSNHASWRLSQSRVVAAIIRHGAHHQTVHFASSTVLNALQQQTTAAALLYFTLLNALQQQ